MGGVDSKNEDAEWRATLLSRPPQLRKYTPESYINGIENPGLRSAQDDHMIFYASDPKGFYYVELDGQLISCVSFVKHGDVFAFVGNYIVMEEFRCKGYRSHLYRHVENELPQHLNQGLDAVGKNIEMYKKVGFTPGWFNRRMILNIADSANCLEKFLILEQIYVQPATQVNLDLLIEYDSIVFGAPHDRF